MELVLRYDDPAVVEHPLHARFATVVPGAPGRCPGCDDFGFLDHLDPRDLVQTQHCRGCGTTWEFRFGADDALLELRCRFGSDGELDLTDPVVVDVRSGADQAAEATTPTAPA